jgi:hypothetical protein
MGEPATAVKKEPKAATPKEPKEAKAPKEPKEPKATRNKRYKFPEEHVITVLKPGAKLRIAAQRFALYKTGMSVKEYIAAMQASEWERTPSQTHADMRWDKSKGLVHIGETVVPVPEPAPAPTAAAA